jgi:putative addiction module component (TIGR02574 family)
MSPTFEQFGFDRLSIEERLALAQELLDSVIAERGAAPLSEAKKRELQRRLADADANPDDFVPWEKVKAEALARCKQ